MAFKPSDAPGTRKIKVAIEELKAQLGRLPCASTWAADIVRESERSDEQLRPER